jgi:hypothetical protein
MVVLHTCMYVSACINAHAHYVFLNAIFEIRTTANGTPTHARALCARAHARARTHANTQTRTHERTRTRTNARTHTGRARTTRTHTRTHARSHARTHTHWLAIRLRPRAGTGNPFFYFAYGASVSEVEVDTLTGDMHVVRAAHRALHAHAHTHADTCTHARTGAYPCTHARARAHTRVHTQNARMQRRSRTH